MDDSRSLAAAVLGLVLSGKLSGKEGVTPWNLKCVAGRDVQGVCRDILRNRPR